MAASRLTPARFGLAYVVVLLVVLGLDALWLGFLAGDYYKREMGPLMSGSVRAVPVALFYLLYPLAFVYLVLFREPTGQGEALVRSIALGLAAYGAYDLTAMAIVPGWPVGLSLVDWAWGGLAAALAGAAAHAATWGRR
jgi:uncharacterized membrane protein